MGWRASRAVALVAALVGASGCSGGDRELFVDLVSDFVAGVEVDAARVVLPGEDGTEVTREVALPLGTDLAAGFRLVEIDDPPSGSVAIRVELLKDDSLVTERTVRARVKKRALVTVVITRDCRDLSCPTAADDPEDTECHAGRCVPESCTPETPETCGPAECEVDGDCPRPSPCVAPMCKPTGACLAGTTGDACGPGEYCAPDEGCTALPTDAGMDAGMDAGTDAGPDASVDASEDAGTDAGPGCPAFDAPIVLAPGDNSQCLVADGARYCWGRGIDGSLGHGAFEGMALDPFRADTMTWTTADVGGSHGCGIQSDGSLWCWGTDFAEQLGLGDGDTPEATPTRVGTEVGWIALDVERQVSCALDGASSLWCWGDNELGQIGVGSTAATISVPTRVEPAGAWAQVDVAQNHACGVRTNGTLWCWGANGNDQRGDPGGGTVTSPVQVGSDSDWARVTTAIEFTCALKMDGTLWCWGANYTGQLGIGSLTKQDTPVQVGTETDWAQADATRWHACGVKTDGTLWCWGSNGHDELGVGSSADRENVPMQVAGDRWAAVVAGDEYTCALRDDDTLWCWGKNNDGQLGVGDTTDRADPTQVCPP